MNEHGIKLSLYMVGKIMAQMGPKSCYLKMHKYKHADEAHKTHNNILNKNFSPSAPNQVWTSDVTYIHIKGGWCYLAVVLDLYARSVVGFAVSDSLKAKWVLFYSDQGVHYTSQKLTESVAECENIAQSMSCRGNYWNNAPTERFPRSLKTEWISKGGYENIWGYYQTVRLHNFNDYFPPAEKEKRHF